MLGNCSPTVEFTGDRQRQDKEGRKGGEAKERKE